MKIDRKKMIEVANLLQIEPMEEVLDQLEEEFNDIEKSLEEMRKIDVKNVEPMSFINEKPTSFLREDVVDESENLSKKDFLKNSKDSDDNFIRIKKVI